MKRKISRDINNYYELGDSETMSSQESVKQTILQLLTIKYDQMCDNKKIIQANADFLTMARILLKERQPDCPIDGIQQLIKLQNFDKEVYSVN